MATSQAGIFDENSTQFYYLEYRLETADREAVAAALTQALSKEERLLHVVVAFGPSAWQLLQPSWMPQSFTGFERINGINGFSIPSTQRDLFFWIHGGDLSTVFDQALHIERCLKPVAALELDERGFIYHNSKDLIGFVDGTANPKEEKRQEAALIPEGEKGAGGSIVLSQKWVHDLDAWNTLSVEMQEKVVGRTKLKDEELEGEAMPPDSHVSRTDLKVDGVAMKIYRRSTPFGTVGEKGLYFLSFACDTLRYSSQLESMFGLSGDNRFDQLIRFSRPVTSSYWFAPSQEDLQEALS